MSMFKGEFYAAGKLYIAGEYAVVEPGAAAILVGLDRGITATAVSAAEYSVASHVYGADPLALSYRPGLRAEIAGMPYDYCAAAITVAEQMREILGLKQHKYALKISSTLEYAEGVKLGLGSSAAVVAAVVGALADFYKMGLDLATVFKLAVIATVQISAQTSCGDIAASIMGGWVHYRSPNRKQILSDYRQGRLIAALTSPGWQGCAAETLPALEGCRLLVGATGRPAKTVSMVQAVHSGSYQHSDSYQKFLREMELCVSNLAAAVKTGDCAAAADAINSAGKLLVQLGSASGVDIETQQLRQLRELAQLAGGAAKFSGAGGGDCGIALAADPPTVAKIIAAWREHGIEPLAVEVTEGCGESIVC